MPEVVGYVENDAIVCPNHVDDPETATPIFDDSEWDYIPACEECAAPLDVRPTVDGLRWVQQTVGVQDEEGNWVVDPRAYEDFVAHFGDVGEAWVKVAIQNGYLEEGGETRAGESEEAISRLYRLLKALSDFDKSGNKKGE